MNKSTDILPFTNPIAKQGTHLQKQNMHIPLPTLAWYTLAIFVCLVLMATPLARMAGTTLQYTMPTHLLLLAPGGWLPINLGFKGPKRSAEMATHVILFFSLLVVVFALYICAARTLWRQASTRSSYTTLRWIWITTLVYGILFLLTPAMLSHDIFAYSSYGRILVVYHANPYFTVFSNFPHDPFYTLDDWKHTPSAYGPIWLIISSVIAFLCGNQPIASLITYQTLGLSFHLLNTLLVIAILRTQKRSERIVAVGALLYAWNPLLLLESSLNGHNDLLMITFILLGLWSFACKEQLKREAQAFQLRGYLFPVLALTLATLVKFSAGPILVLFLVLLGRRAFLATAAPSSEGLSLQRWQKAIQTICLAGLVSGGVIALFYGPFWIGWSIPAIIGSFSTTPAAYSAYGSILLALEKSATIYGQPTSGLSGFLFSLFLKRSTWNSVDSLTTGIGMLLAIYWIWRTPTMRTLVLAALAVLGTLLLVTPWFFPWYVTWLVPLAIICLPTGQEKLSWALIGSTLVFSASSLCIYLYARNVPPIGGWVGLACLSTILPPILTFILLLRFPFIQKEKLTEMNNLTEDNKTKDSIQVVKEF